MQNTVNTPNGLQYLPSFITQKDADALLDFIDAHEWDVGLKRRVQHYGWLYDYRSSRVDLQSYLGPLPKILEQTAMLIGTSQTKRIHFDQVIVNDYAPGQGISAHVDCVPCFGPVVASISLGSTCEMKFQNVASNARTSLLLEPLSLLILSDDARYGWSHAIPARRSDIINGGRLSRARRVSITFRTKLK